MHFERDLSEFVFKKCRHCFVVDFQVDFNSSSAKCLEDSLAKPDEASRQKSYEISFVLVEFFRLRPWRPLSNSASNHQTWKNDHFNREFLVITEAIVLLLWSVKSDDQFVMKHSKFFSVDFGTDIVTGNVDKTADTTDKP